jgi:hypothetical protein
MQEAILQFVWQYNLYRPGMLRTTDGQVVRVVHPGTLNRHSGPDFSMGRVHLNEVLLIGAVEIHIRSSDWKRHHHDGDPAYERVVLHVVYEHDLDAPPAGIPLLELKPHIDPEILERCRDLIHTTASLPCAGLLHKAGELTRSSWLSRMLVERWEQRFDSWRERLQQTGGDWHGLLYERLAANFGFKTNAPGFEMLARSLSFRMVSRQLGLFQLEALFFGQSGLLAGHFTDEYPQQLQGEYAFQTKKYKLKSIDPSLWKFMRLRPANFPTIRLAQFAGLMQQGSDLIDLLRPELAPDAVCEKLNVRASSYWNTHYRFDDGGCRSMVKRIGNSAIENLIVNTIAPMRYFYAMESGRGEDAGAALEFLEMLPPEDNNILRLWRAHDWPATHAAAAQGQLQLYNSYCCAHRCLDCAIGLAAIRGSGPGK